MSQMPKIEESDFRALDSFRLKWRWTDTRWNKLPNNALSSIHPLSESKAHELFHYLLAFSDHFGLIEPLFESTSRINTFNNSSEIRQWLLEQTSDLNQTVIVSWNKELAVLVSWKVFCDYWDDFCYPSSDDVAIFPQSGGWMLIYSHEEYFMFGKAIIKDSA